jgi:hypothetical protein
MREATSSVPTRYARSRMDLAIIHLSKSNRSRPIMLQASAGGSENQRFFRAWGGQTTCRTREQLVGHRAGRRLAQDPQIADARQVVAAIEIGHAR